jgi:hypothetical protein
MPYGFLIVELDLPMHQSEMKEFTILIICNKTIKIYGFKSSGSFDTCEQCAIAKAQQKKNFNKDWLGSSNLPGECL